MIRAALVPMLIGLVVLFMVPLAMGGIGTVELLVLLAILVPGVAIAIWRRVRAVRDDAVPAPR